MKVTGFIEDDRRTIGIIAENDFEAEVLRDAFDEINDNNIELRDDSAYTYPILVIRKERIPCPNHQQL